MVRQVRGESMIKVTFLGAARTVTGSKHLVESNGTRVLVDAGLFQGLKELRERNWQDLPIKASDIDAIVLTHAHLDHCGYLPRLVAQGFRGRVFCTAGTQDLCRIVLPDAGRLQEEDAAFANRHGFSKHAPALPLYTEIDASRAVSQLQPCGYDRSLPVAAGIEVEFINAGHLLGSSLSACGSTARPFSSAGISGASAGRSCRIRRWWRRRTTCWSSRPTATAFTSRTKTGHAWPRWSSRPLSEVAKLIIPSFAIGRVEELIYWLRRLEVARRIPALPVFVDSPMAAAALARYSERLHELDPELQPELGDEKAPHDAAAHEASANAASRLSRSATSVHSARTASASSHPSRSRSS